MIFREAIKADIPQIQVVRNAVKENMLSNPALVTDADCEEFLFVRGKGWVCEIDDVVVGFAIADLQENNIWALFVTPAFAEKGIGKKLHSIMLKWYFEQTDKTVWLGTEPNSRAEIFYSKTGWTKVGMHGSKEVKFEMTFNDWKSFYKD